MPFISPNVTDIPSLFQYANVPTFGWFWPLMLLTIYIIVYVTLSTRTYSKNAFASTGFFVGVLGILMFVLGLISELPMIIALVGAIAGFISMMFQEGSG